MKKHNDFEALDSIIHKTVKCIEDGKKGLFDISEKSRIEYSNCSQELHQIKMQLTLVINEVDKLEIRSRMARNMISTINAHFDEFSEKDIKEAYDIAKNVQVELSLKQKEEYELNARRNDLERILKNTEAVIIKSEILETKVSVALDYLTSSFDEQIGDQRIRKDINYKIIEAQENEKKRISRDMHDGPAQSLANIIFKSEYLSKIIETAPNKARKEISEIQEDIRTTLKDIRKIIYDLMPMSLDDLGLVPTLKRLISNIEETNHIDVITRFEIEDIELSNMIKLMIFRIVQESFNNIVKHAKALQIDITLSINKESILLLIADDGVGFDFNNLSKFNKGFGLYNMKERVELLDGFFNIDSKEAEGTTIKVQIPIKNDGGYNGES